MIPPLLLMKTILVQLTALWLLMTGNIALIWTWIVIGAGVAFWSIKETHEKTDLSQPGLMQMPFGSPQAIFFAFLEITIAWPFLLVARIAGRRK